MRLYSLCSTDSPGATNFAVTGFLMFAHIISTMLLTLSSSADAASLASITNKYRHRTKLRFTRSVPGDGTESMLKESVGERECTASEKQKQGCLAGSCTALRTSQYHTFVICRCPSNRQGARCEEIAINTDVIAVELQKDELCKQERYDVLLASFGYESLFFTDCVTKNYPNLNLDDKKERRAKLKKMRERARKRKLRKRERKRNKKKSQRSSEKSNIFSENIDTRDNLKQKSDTPDHLLILEDEFNNKKTTKDHSGHNHKVRHESEKSSGRRRRKSLTTFLVGTPTATAAATTTTPTTRYIRPSH